MAERVRGQVELLGPTQRKKGLFGSIRSTTKGVQHLAVSLKKLAHCRIGLIVNEKPLKLPGVKNQQVWRMGSIFGRIGGIGQNGQKGIGMFGLCGRIRDYAVGVMAIVLVFSYSSLFSHKAWGQGDSAQRPRVGKSAAARYFAERNRTSEKTSDEDESDRRPGSSTSPSNAARYLGLHLGTYLDEDVYKWGANSNKNVGKLNVGVSYRMGEWVKSMDLLLRVDFSTFEFKEGRALKMSMLPLVSFPDAKSGFPLYFGGGAGVGVFFKQVRDESSLSFDYQVVTGLRLFNLIGMTGLTLEAGLKNHVLLLSDGQYNGVFVALGSVFNF